MADSQKSKAEPSAASDDVALICGSSEDGSELAIVRRRDKRIEAGVARRLEHGKSISGEVVRLKPRADSPLCDVETLFDTRPKQEPAALEASPSKSDRGHPAQVASDTYRSGWDAIWQQPASKLLN